MALNIHKAYPLVVHDIVKEKAAPLLEQGAKWADSPKELAARCDVISTCLPGPPDMETVTLGENGILAGARPGSTYIDHTTNSPLLVRRIHDIFKEKGVGMLDAPISGGTEGARIKELLIMVGGDKETFEKCKPVLDTMGNVMYTGGTGNGMICKVTHNCAGFCVGVAMMESWAVAIRAGVDPATIVNVFQNAAIGRNLDVQIRLPNTLFQGKFDPIFALKVARKDFGLATEMARAYGVPIRVSELVEQEYIEAMNRGWGDKDSSIVLTLEEERAGVKVRVPSK